MQAMLKFDDQAKAVAMATGGGVLAAIVAMFIPTGIWETLTGSTGISEMVPATAAPLGDTARALISYAFGALTLLVLSMVFLRRTGTQSYTAIAHDEPFWTYSEPFEESEDVVDAEVFEYVEDIDDSQEEVEPSIVARIRARIAAFVEARRNGDAITDLEELPKLRAGDAHPDAPPRRPFSANRDILEAEGPAVDASEAVLSVETVEAEWVEPIEVEATEIEPEIEAQPVPAYAATASTTSHSTGQSTGISSLDDMVSRFESALAERDAQLAHIEKFASELPVSNVQPIRPDMAPAAAYEPVPAEPAPLRAVVRDEDMPADVPQRPESEELDAALRSALETLHRMNARTR